MGDYNFKFKAFLKEALFTKEILGLGATQIRKANYAFKGLYYEAFTCLSAGFERIGKLCLILDYYINNNGTLPDFDYLKKIGHDLVKIYDKSSEVTQKHDITFHFLNNLDAEIYQNILKILSDFACSDRYSNINILSQGKQQNDSIANWSNTIDQYIYEKYVSHRKKEKIYINARFISNMMQGYSYVQYISETGETMEEVETASIQTRIYEAVAPFRQLFILQMIRYWSELISELGNKAQKINNIEMDIPYFYEIFAPFFNSDSYFKSKKIWYK